MDVLEHIRAVMLRASRVEPLSEDERDAFVLFSAQLKRQLDAIEERVLVSDDRAVLDAVRTLRHLLEAMPGISV
jgi:hypothetical protein